MAGSRSASPLLRRLADKTAPVEERVRIADDAARSVRQPFEAWQVLGPIMLDLTEAMEVRVAAARAARHCGIAAVNHLVRGMPAAPRVRAAAVESLRAIAAQPLPAYFEGRLHEDLATLERQMSPLPLANLAGTYGADRRVIEVAHRALAHDDLDVRWAALSQLCSIGETDVAVSVLRKSPDGSTRAVAAELLGYYWAGDEHAAMALERALDDREESVRSAAHTARRRLRLERSPRPRRTSRPPVPEEADPRFPWRGFLERWSRELLQVEAVVLNQPDDVVESGWLGAPGASEERIQSLEERLGRRLPPSYRGFLATSDGFRGGGSSIARIRPAAEIRPFVEEERQWVEIWAADGPTISEREHRIRRDDVVAFHTAYLRTAIQVSDVTDSAVYLLSPDVVDAEGEWEAWLFASWLPGARRYRSFWVLLQAEHENFLAVESSQGPAE